LDEAQQQLEETPPAEPAQESPADRHFEQAVKAFEAGDYAAAAARFHDAQQLAPDDVVVPFAHVQALFAGGEYKKAAEFLRKALIKTSPDKEGVFYPRGLYTDDGVLQRQVDQLARAVRLSPSDADLELLLGYQLLGMNRLDEAVGHLQNAKLDSKNSQAATVLMSLLEKLIKADNNNAGVNEQQADKPGEQQSGSPEVKPAGQKEDSAPEERDNKDVDLHALAISAETWLLEE
jgi:tetratricopeptide (TPR) repeat protein